MGYNHLAVFACVTSGVHIIGGRPGQIAVKVCQISHLGLGRWDGGENLETGTCGENNWYMGTLSRMIAGHEEKRGYKGQEHHGILSLGMQHGRQASRQGRKGFVMVVGN